jgi:hypothetical protein
MESPQRLGSNVDNSQIQPLNLEFIDIDYVFDAKQSLVQKSSKEAFL